MVQGQENASSISGTIYDDLEGRPLPFIAIYKKKDRKGTTTDFNGRYSLDNVLNSDTVIINAIGYQKTSFTGKQLADKDTVHLRREVQLIDEVVVLADSFILYRLISEAKKTPSKLRQIGKSYLELETYCNNNQLELFQGYYNGTFKGYNVESVSMKNGRFALSPMGKRIFASTEVSKAIYKHKLLEANDYFPYSPFEYNRRKLRKNYRLSLNSKYRNDQNEVIYIVRFQPIKDVAQHFAGRVWIDSASHAIRKVKFEIEEAKRHPFKALWPEHTLKKVNMEITKTFRYFRGGLYVDNIDFNYGLDYVSNQDSVLTIKSQAMLKPYTFEDQFSLPKFKFARMSNNDYRTLQMLPRNNDFWTCDSEFKPNENNEQRQQYMEKESTITNEKLFSGDSIFKRNFFESPYVTWNGNRIFMREEMPEKELKTVHTFDRVSTTSQQYHLEVQLFADLTEACDSTTLISKTIFDPYESFYRLPMTTETHIFINLYFDLMEIERRKFESAMRAGELTSERLNQEYRNAIESMNKVSSKFFREVERGTQSRYLKEWNERVKNELKIDNLELFNNP